MHLFLRCSFASAMRGKEFISQSNVDWEARVMEVLFSIILHLLRVLVQARKIGTLNSLHNGDFFLLRKRIPHWNGRLTSAQIWNTIKCILIELLLTWRLRYLRIISSCIMLFAFRFKLSLFAMMSCRACSNLISFLCNFCYQELWFQFRSKLFQNRLY